MELQRYICKTCGQPIDLSEAAGGVLTCPSCGNTYTLPKEDANDETRAYLRAGEHDLDRNDFNGAYAAFDRARSVDPEEPEAYRGMALAESQVRYLKDTVNNRLQPVCFLHDDKKFTENENYKRALALATPEQRADYRKKAEEIDYIRKQFRALRESGTDYDCFLCVKVSDDNGEKTDDARAADEIYDLLKRRGYSPFFSERDVQDKTGADYEAEILYALYTSETMLVICRDEKYLHTKWVQNEYSRFLKLVNDEEKESDSITTVYYGTPVERLPGRAGKIQGIDYRKTDAAVKILEFVEAHTPRAKAKRQEAAKRKEREAEEIRRQIEEQKREFEEKQRLLQQELEGKLKSIKSDENPAPSGNTATVTSLLKRAAQEMEFNNMPSAREYFNKVLDIAPENCEAWWGLFLLDFNVKKESELLEKLTAELSDRIEANRNYVAATKYYEGSGGAIEDRIYRFIDYLDTPEVWWNLFLKQSQASSLDDLLARLRKNTSLIDQVAASPELQKTRGLVAVHEPNGKTAQSLRELKEQLASDGANYVAARQKLAQDIAETDRERIEIERKLKLAKAEESRLTNITRSKNTVLSEKQKQYDGAKYPDKPYWWLALLCLVILAGLIVGAVFGIQELAKEKPSVLGLALMGISVCGLFFGGWFFIWKSFGFIPRMVHYKRTMAKRNAFWEELRQAQEERTKAIDAASKQTAQVQELKQQQQALKKKCDKLTLESNRLRVAAENCNKIAAVL